MLNSFYEKKTIALKIQCIQPTGFFYKSQLTKTCFIYDTHASWRTTITPKQILCTQMFDSFERAFATEVITDSEQLYRRPPSACEDPLPVSSHKWCWYALGISRRSATRQQDSIKLCANRPYYSRCKAASVSISIYFWDICLHDRLPQELWTIPKNIILSTELW